MPVEYGKASEFAKEMRKHEAFPTEHGPAGRPYTYREFPKRMYLAGRPTTLKIEIIDAQTAHDEHEERNLLSRGFCFGQDKAIAAIEAEQTAHGELAAAIEYDVRHGKHSDRAVAEVRAAQADHKGHLPEVPRTPIKRGRPKKEAVPA